MTRHQSREGFPSATQRPCIPADNPTPFFHLSSMALNFAPYQSASPETNRALSPPPPDNRSTSPAGRRSFSPPSGVRSPPLQPPISSAWSGAGYRDIESGGREGLNEFETSLPLRLDYEACLAYLLLPPAGGVLLLVLEHKSDYVRLVSHALCAWSRRQ